MRKFLQLLTLFTAISVFSAHSQVNITNIATAYTEDFNTLASSGSTNSILPAGWTFLETGTNANSTYAADGGGGSAGNTYSYGQTPISERAFGTLRSGSLQSVIGVSFINNTGSTITSMSINFRGEEWRLGATGRNDTLQFQYSLDATDLASGTWVDENGLDFITPSTTGSTGGRDGNASGNNANLSTIINGLSIPNGGTFWLRWVDTDATGADDGLAVDDVNINFSGTPIVSCQEPVSQATTLVLTPAAESMTGSFTAASPVADEYLVVRSTSTTLSATPADAVAYSVGEALGGGIIVSTGSAITFSDADLSPNTTYYYFVFSANSQNCNGGPNYLTTNPLTGNKTTLSLPACVTPPASATNLVLTPSNTSVSGSFTASASANRYLVVKSLSSSLGANPSNGTTYTGGQALGNGTVVSYSTTTNFIATGLIASTQYYFFVFAANGDCNGEPFYRTVALTGNVTTTNTSTGIPPGYYNGTANLTCAALKTALKNIISANTIQLTYTPDVWNAFTTTDMHPKDDNSGNIIWDIYTDNPTGPETYTFTFGTNQCGTYSKEGDCYNREHSFPQEWFGSKQYPMYSDLNHVFPVDGWVNGKHDSNPYGEVSNPTFTSISNKSKLGPNSFGCYTGTVFEPIDAYKGDIARAQLYMITRYQDSMVKWKTNGNADAVLNGTFYPSLDDWYIQLLLKWHHQDPVSQKEIDRNNAIYALQGNRNPFIDVPEFADSMFKCVSYQCVVPVILLDFNVTKNSQSNQLKWSVNREVNFKNYEIQRSTDGRTFNSIGTINGINSGSYLFNDYDLTNFKTFYYRLKMVDIDGKFTYSKVVSVRLQNVFSNALVFPNPTGNALTIKLKDPLTESSSLLINDITGRTVLLQKVNALQNNIQLDVHYFPAGRYFITIKNSNEMIHESFIILK